MRAVCRALLTRLIFHLSTFPLSLSLSFAFLRVSQRVGETPKLMPKRYPGARWQNARGPRVTSRLVFRFKDGSLHDETAVFTQRQQFRLVNDHLVQKGPSFPQPIDMTIDAAKGQVAVPTKPELGFAANMLYMLNGKPASKDDARAFDASTHGA